MVQKQILIIGHHPIVGDVIRQFELQGCRINHCDSWELRDGVAMPRYDELCLLPTRKDSTTQTDNESLHLLEQLALAYQQSASEPQRRRPVCHLLLHSQVTLWLLQTQDLYQDINDQFELYAFTMEDQWAKNVFCHVGQPLQHAYPPLDRTPILAESHQTVHLVIWGLTDMGESLATHAALTAHYPNYVRHHALRTRITIIDDGGLSRRDTFVQRHQDLFHHSYYRYIDLRADDSRQTLFHYPLYSGSREDFVDVEWEFVGADLHHPLLQQKLTLWAQDPEQQLTVALCHEQADRNFSEAFALPKAIYEQSVPVLVTTPQAGLLQKASQSYAYHHLYPIGMTDCGYDVTLPLLQMAKRLHYFYTCSFGQKGTPTSMPIDEIEQMWSEVESFSLRYSNIYNVMTIATKMRSLGHDQHDWGRFYALTQEEIERTSAVEHNRWSVERMLLGFRPPTDSERADIRANIAEWVAARRTGQPLPKENLKKAYKRRKIHYDLCAYSELSEDETGKDVRIYDYDLTACIPLIANSFNEQQP